MPLDFATIADLPALALPLDPTVNFLADDGVNTGRVPLSAISSGSLGAFYNPLSFNCVGDGVTDDTTNWNSMIAEINSAAVPAAIWLPPGKNFAIGAATPITARTDILGFGRGDLNGASPVSGVTGLSATVAPIEFQAHGSRAQNFGLIDGSGSSTPTNAGILFTEGYGSQVVFCSVQGFGRCVDFVDGGENQIQGNLLTGFAIDGIRIRNVAVPDGGDSAIIGNQIMSRTRNATGDAIRQDSGGGLKIIGNKINNRSGSFKRGYHLFGTAGVNTILLLIVGNSFENMSEEGILCEGSGGAWQNLLMSGNQFGHYGSVNKNAIKIDSTSTDFDRVVIADSIFNGSASSTLAAIDLTSLDNVAIGSAVRSVFPKLVSATSVTNIRNDMARYGVQLLVDGATITPDAINSENMRVTLGGNRTLANMPITYDGCVSNIRVIQDGTGSRTLAYGSKYKFPGGTTPVLSTAPGAKDLLSFQYDATDDTFFLVAQKAFA